MTLNRDELTKYIPGAINETSLAGLGNVRRGKVRDIYETDDAFTFVTTDRVSAFDKVITTIPFKGFILNSVAGFWFERTKHIVANHLIDMPHPHVMHVRKLQPIDVEMVVRAYITGVTSTSLWTIYSSGERVIAGHTFPDGMKKNQKLDEPIITPSTKAHTGHDKTVSREDILESGVVSEAVYDRMAEASLALFDFGSRHCARQGVIFVDTKYEFGFDENGEVMLMDEVHTPDSSRFWAADSWQQALKEGKDPVGFDKEYVRKWLKGRGYGGDGEPPDVPDDVRAEAALRYIDAYRKITGREFEPPYDNALGSLESWASSL